MTREKMSLKKVLSRFNVGMILLIVVVSLFFGYLNLSTLSDIGSITIRNNEMLSLYDQVESGHNSIRKYLQDNDVEHVNDFELAMQEARRLTQQFKTYGYSEWRYDLLANMIDSYASSAHLVLDESSPTFQTDYDDFTLTYDIFMDSAKEYYAILVKDTETASEHANERIRISMLIGLIVIVIFIVWTLGMSNALLKWFFVPLSRIGNNILKIKHDDYDLEVVNANSIELDDLDRSVREMSAQILKNTNLTREVYELEQLVLLEKNSNLKNKELSSKATLQAIRNQLNPHFLFNTLNIIYKLTLNDDSHGASKLLERTSQFLRYNLDYSDDISNLNHEIASVRDYIYIQEMRFQDRIRFELNVDENLPMINLPGLIIQPLIENSITHGFARMPHDCEVVIEITEDAGLLTILVSDNGIGMAETDIDRIYMNDFEYFDHDFDLGLYTTMKRLKKVFDKRVSFSINTSVGVGFEVVIQIEVT